MEIVTRDNNLDGTFAIANAKNVIRFEWRFV